ncbi:hypothetical protein COX95_04935 [bacterium CG_4_10_14_0_2_um_filter_33_32]|nr:MAG: hypothetical protein AUJ93_04060 [bacterium CG2_30_33_46]PIR67569.1 MAG: hypothetical protein COU50_02490 [bacterium CG10_big_fil_rev_8_21_14_0_10_33_18]PIU76443.1 MAG: hypothetical protein COS74_03900 [bacterium CG06_land_8_20_14_3_00_33_50]PIW81161.1 MAG: hypothetical protein COZ97_03360 [bacterium CG_4_8_14_3_um_filter_33_28]PIY84881.1 MAG: hypothetical protein COY76_04740 [bacterium CG_4_10_14_0_8_um_filter_33_57]PIZ85199.1 MAG: hypothetical protein COX95_04935 [bacterium CG_4_10_1
METPNLKILTREEVHELSHQSDSSSPTCAFCGSDNVYGISRVVGYYSPINNWNLSKQAELEARQKGDYRL